MVPCRSDFSTPCCLPPSVAGSALGATHFGGHIHVHCRYGPVTRDLPEGDLVDRLQDLGSPPPCYPNYGASDCYPGRSTLLTTPRGFPCCVHFPCVHAAATTPAQRLGVLLRSFTQPCQPSPKGSSGRPAHRPFRCLLGVHSRYGLHTRAVTNS